MPRLGGYIKLAVVLLILIALLLPTQAYAAKGDGIFIYGEGTVTTPRYRTWTNSSNTVKRRKFCRYCSRYHKAYDSRQAPTRNEVIMGVQTTTGGFFIFNVGTVVRGQRMERYGW